MAHPVSLPKVSSNGKNINITTTTTLFIIIFGIDYNYIIPIKFMVEIYLMLTYNGLIFLLLLICPLLRVFKDLFLSPL